MFTKEDLIHTYSRAEALDDGVLIDAGPLARELGFKHPVALTVGAWNACVRLPAGVVGQDERGRLWDVLWPMHLAVRRAEKPATEIRFDVVVRIGRRRERKTLRAVCGPADDGSPCVTVMLSDEDCPTTSKTLRAASPPGIISENRP